VAKFRIDPLVVQLRLYDNEIDDALPLKDMDEPYSHIITGLMMDNGVCRFTGAEQKLGSERIKIKRKFRKMGIDRVEWRHKKIEHSFKLRN
jgi:hypothetical protein